MQIAYNIFLILGLIVAVVFSLLVFLTGKGDAMSGGGSVRTTFKGKASFDDFISRWTLIPGASFMALMLLIDVLGNRATPTSPISAPISGGTTSPPTNPGTSTSAPNTSTPTAPTAPTTGTTTAGTPVTGGTSAQ